MFENNLNVLPFRDWRLEHLTVVVSESCVMTLFSFGKVWKRITDPRKVLKYEKDPKSFLLSVYKEHFEEIQEDFKKRLKKVS